MAAHCKVYGYSSVICSITAEPTEMPFGLLALMGPRNHVLDGGPNALMRMGNFEGERAAHCKAQGRSAVSCAKTAELIEMLFALCTWVGSRKHILDEAQIPHVKGQLLGGRTCLGMPDNTLLSAAQTWLNLSICCLGCGLGWAERSTSSIIFARWRQCNLTGGHIRATWRIQLNCPSVAAMQPYVILL